LLKNILVKCTLIDKLIEEDYMAYTFPLINTSSFLFIGTSEKLNDENTVDNMETSGNINAKHVLMQKEMKFSIISFLFLNFKYSCNCLS